MTEDNKNNEQQQTITNLKRLRQIAEEQGKTEFVAALDTALKALGNEQQQGDDGMRLSTPADQLLELANKVRSTSLSPTQRVAAAHHLVRLGGGR